MRHAKLALILSVCSFAVYAVPVQAAEAQEAESASTNDIIVTAQRRSEKQVDVPITITTLNQQQLQTANVQQLTDISKVTPGLRFNQSGGFFQPTIRGVGTPVVTSGGGSNVGIYVDGFYSPNPLAGAFKLMNVNSVQVLKGPQGTLFGRNTTGGAILVQTADPSTEASGQLKLTYGRFDDTKMQGYATFGLSDRIAVDVEGMYSAGNGWRRDISNNNKRVGDYESWSVRAGIKADLTDNLSVLLRYQHSYDDDPNPVLTSSYYDPDFGTGAPNFALPSQVTYKHDQIASGSIPELHTTKSDVVQGTIKADLGFADLTSYTQYRKEKVNSSLDLDYSGADVFQLGLPNDNETWSYEFLLTSKPGTRLQWTTGLFYFSNRDTYFTYIDNYGSDSAHRIRYAGSSTTSKSYAAFADLTYELTPKLFLTAGARYAHDEVTDAYWNVPFLADHYIDSSNNVISTPGGIAKVPSISSDRVTPRVVLRYKPTDRSSLYASYTMGYKAAIIDVGGSCQNAVNLPTSSNPTGAGYTCNDVKPETINSYEIGYKFNNRVVSAEISGFYYDYKNLQVSEYLGGTANIVNAARSEIYGIDAQVSVKLSNQFSVTAAGAWTHARYKHFDNVPIYTRCPTLAGCGAGTSFYLPFGIDLDNITMQRSPSFTGNMGLKYNTQLAGGEVVLTSNLYYSSKLYFGPSGIQFPQKGYATLSLRAQWTDPTDTYTVAVWGDNVTNRRYINDVMYGAYGVGTNWNKPATYGIELGAKF